MKQVLIADDTKNIRTLLTTCMEIEGYTVTSAVDGQQAFDFIQGKKFDLIFLDIKMPLLSGTEVLRRSRELGIGTPVIIMTAFATVKNAVECTKLGAVAYLQKPFTVDKIRATLEELPSTLSGQNNILNTIDTLNEIRENIKFGRYDDALDQLKKAISLEPTDAELYLLFGKAYEAKGDGNHAQKFFETYRLFKNNS